MDLFLRFLKKYSELRHSTFCMQDMENNSIKGKLQISPPNKLNKGQLKVGLALKSILKENNCGMIWE